MKYLKQLKLKIKKNELIISVLGLGYVGLPVAFYFSKKFKVFGYDISKKRILDLRKGIDSNKTFSKFELKKNKIHFEYKDRKIKDSDVYIITTPTPINKAYKPNLDYIFKALDLIIKLGIKYKLIILESTVFPGATEEKFIKYLEDKTSFKINNEFYFGYSPERINPGDKKNKFFNISKIVAGSFSEVTDITHLLYKKVVKKVYKATSIKVAETSKLIENSQRDLNIAFVNEIVMICNKLKLQSKEVLELASTKWNFLKFKPGLVGGHCIGVDPYYLFHALRRKKYNPKMLLAGRSLNENFSKFLVQKFLNKIALNSPKILIMGASYKADCNDLRNSKCFDIFNELKKRNCTPFFFDPHVTFGENKALKKYNFVKNPKKHFYDGIMICVAHTKFKTMGFSKISLFGKNNCKIFDIKNIFSNQKEIMHL